MKAGRGEGPQPPPSPGPAEAARPRRCPEVMAVGRMQARFRGWGRPSSRLRPVGRGRGDRCARSPGRAPLGQLEYSTAPAAFWEMQYRET